MYKTHKQYYLRAYNIKIDPIEKDDRYKKHYEKGQEQRLTESKLDDNIAEYFQLVTEFIILTGKRNHFQCHFQKIFKYDHPKSSNFNNCSNEEELVSELKIEEKRLNEEYNQLRNIFESIQISIEPKQ